MKISTVAQQELQNGFSSNFLWGAAISAKQAEGSADRGLTVADIQDYNPNNHAKVKGDFTREEILERVEHPNQYIFPKKKGIDFYHQYRSDLELLKQMGLKAFRLSISWSRIYPNGDYTVPSEAGLSFYDKLFDTMQSLSITPIVTLYHDDMPVDLALKYNGFLDEQVCDWFVNYATTVLTRYQNRVKFWIPVNQINLTRVGLSALGIVRDQVTELDQKKFETVHHKFVMCARIKAIGRKINPEFKFGCMLADFLVNPETCKPEDVTLATEKNQMTMYFFADVQLRGEYPKYALRYLKDHQIDFTIQDGDLQLIRDNRLDFLAISYYNSNVVSADKNSMAIGDSELNPYLKANPWGWTINPLGLYDSFLKYWDRYHSPLMIAENGFGQIEELDENDTVHDDYRIDYLRQHLQALKNAVEKGVDVFAYCAWSPIDMVSSGTSEMKKRYGFIYNDLNNDGTGSGKRYPKDSFYWYQKVIASNGISI